MAPPDPRRRARTLLTVGLCLWIGLPVVGVGISTLAVARSFDRVSGVDPSGKARFVAEGISEAMNFTALVGIVGSVVGIPLAGVGFVRLRRLQKNQGDGST